MRTNVFGVKQKLKFRRADKKQKKKTKTKIIPSPVALPVASPPFLTFQQSQQLAWG
jgi:hypothetical protein